VARESEFAIGNIYWRRQQLWSFGRMSNTYGSNTIWARVDGRGYVHRHQKKVLTMGKVCWRGEVDPGRLVVARSIE
jgi:hypothetical protein